MAENAVESEIGERRGLSATPRSIVAFALRVIAWGVVFFGVWILAAKPISIAAGWGAARLLEVAPRIEHVDVAWRDGRIVFGVEPDVEAGARLHLPPRASLEVPIDTLKFTYGVPFFLALMLASRSCHLRAVAAAVIALGLLALVGIACEMGISLAAVASPAGAKPLAPGPLPMTVLALGFQLGTLMFPSLLPVALWFALVGRKHASIMTFARDSKKEES